MAKAGFTMCQGGGELPAALSFESTEPATIIPRIQRYAMSKT